MQELMTTYFGYAFILSFGLYTGMAIFGSMHANTKVKDQLAYWLMGEHNDTWAKQFVLFFESIFGGKHLSLRCVLSSISASIIAVWVLYILFGPVLGILDKQVLDGHSFWKTILLGAAINLVPDYFSLWETRWVLKRFQAIRSKLLMGLILLSDLIISAIIILIGITLWRLLGKQDPLEIGEIIGGFSVYSIFFYSTFLTSVWSWLYCVTSFIMRSFSEKLSAFLQITETPFRQLGLVSAILLFSSMASFKLLPQHSIHKTVCKLPGQSLAYHCIRTAPTAKIQLDHFDASFHNFPIAEIGSQFSQLFAKYDINLMKEIAENQETLCKSKSKRTNSCLISGYYYSTQKFEVGKNPAIDLYKIGCEYGNSMTCYNLAIMYQMGHSVELDMNLAANYHHSACLGDINEACFNLATMYDDGEGVEINVALATRLFKISCDRGTPRACALAGLNHKYRLGAEGDKKLALSLFSKACDGKVGAGCFELGKMYIYGESTDADSLRAIKLLEKACEYEVWRACHFASIVYEYGEGIPKDEGRALLLLKRACQGGDITACEPSTAN